MPSTSTETNNTLSRIQQDIMENTRREKELHVQYQHLYNTKHPSHQQEATPSGAISSDNEDAEVTPRLTNGTVNGLIKLNGFNKSKPQAKSNWTPLLRAISSSSLVTPPQQQNGSAFSSMPYQRIFTTAKGFRGAMKKFIESRGKVAQVKALPVDGFSAHQSQLQQAIPDVEATTRITVDPSKRKFVRKNFVPIEERMKREFQEMHSREKELHAHRKSLSTLNLADIGKDDDEDRNHREEFGDYPMCNDMKSARSMGELFVAVQNNGHRDREYDSEDELERHHERESTGNLGRNRHVAKSLAELCDAPEEEIFTPGPQAVIMQFENMIRKNQQHRA